MAKYVSKRYNTRTESISAVLLKYFRKSATAPWHQCVYGLPLQRHLTEDNIIMFDAEDVETLKSTYLTTYSGSRKYAVGNPVGVQLKPHFRIILMFSDAKTAKFSPYELYEDASLSELTTSETWHVRRNKEQTLVNNFKQDVHKGLFVIVYASGSAALTIGKIDRVCNDEVHYTTPAGTKRLIKNYRQLVFVPDDQEEFALQFSMNALIQ